MHQPALNVGIFPFVDVLPQDKTSGNYTLVPQIRERSAISLPLRTRETHKQTKLECYICVFLSKQRARNFVCFVLRNCFITCRGPFVLMGAQCNRITFVIFRSLDTNLINFKYLLCFSVLACLDVLFANADNFQNDQRVFKILEKPFDTISSKGMFIFYLESRNYKLNK